MKKSLLFMAIISIIFWASLSSAEEYRAIQKISVPADVEKVQDKGIISQSPDKPSRLERCLFCCAERLKECYDREGRTRRCDVNYQNCVATCTSRGETYSPWYDCWTSSE